LSKNVIRGGGNITSFNDMLKPVSQTALGSGKRNLSRAPVVSQRDRAKEEGFAEGYADGKADGYRNGYADGTQRASEDFEAQNSAVIVEFELEDVVASTGYAVERWYQEAEQRLAALAMEIARRALCKELETSQESVMTIVKEALEEVTHGSKVRIRVNPFGAGIIEARREEVLASLSHIRNLEVVADASIEGGCVIESDGGVVDARIDTFLARITNAIREAA